MGPRQAGHLLDEILATYVPGSEAPIVGWRPPPKEAPNNVWDPNGIFKVTLMSKLMLISLSQRSPLRFYVLYALHTVYVRPKS